MSRRGENIYKRKDGRYEGRYVIGKTPAGRTRFGYVYARQYAEVRAMLLQRKAERLQADRPSSAYHGTLADWMERWMEDELLDSVKESSWQTYSDSHSSAQALLCSFCRTSLCSLLRCATRFL